MQLIDFSQQLLERSGALVHRDQNGNLEVLAPAPVRKILQIPEWVQLSFLSPGSFNSNSTVNLNTSPAAHLVSLESEWLERFTTLLAESGQHTTLQLHDTWPKLKSPEKLIESVVALENATCRFVNIQPAWTRYEVMSFRYEARSDEQRDGIVHFAVNLHTQSIVDDLSAVPTDYTHLLAPQAETTTVSLPNPLSETARQALVQRNLSPRIHTRIANFVLGMQRRLERDGKRLHDYHQALIEEAWQKINRHESGTKTKGRATKDRKTKNNSTLERNVELIDREKLRIQAVEREHGNKIEDLRNKYALMITATHLQTLELIAPVLRINLLVRRRKGERSIDLDYNTVLKKLEPLPDAWGDALDPVRIVCDDALHLLSRAGHAPCKSCGHRYCRVCSMKCSKCRQ